LQEELETFFAHEKALGRNDLVLPVYYIDVGEEAVVDPAAAATFERLLERQYDDWRDLSGLRPSDPRMQRALAALARKIRTAATRIGATRATAMGEAPTRPFPPADDEWPGALDDLFAADPVTSRAAAERVAARGAEAIPDVVDRLRKLTTPTIFVLRELLARFPDVSAGPMAARVERADSSWHAALHVPSCFSPSHAPFCADGLGRMVTRVEPRIDAVRLALESLGYLDADGWSSAILDLVRDTARTSEDLSEKYHSYAIEALARLVALAPLEAQHLSRVDGRFGYLEAAIEVVSDRAWARSQSYARVQRILSRGGPHQADHLSGRWLTSKNHLLRDTAAYALGGIGVRRAVPPLLSLAADSAERDDVRATAIFAVGAIGGAGAVNGLDGLEVPSSLAGRRDLALAYCTEHAASDEQFSAIAKRLIAGNTFEKCWVYRAIGRRRDASFVHALREGLHDAETTVRADSALALARVAGSNERPALEAAHAEAATSREKVLTTLALLATGGSSPEDPDLAQFRRLLAAESFIYRSKTQLDILDVLRTCDHSSARAIADAWEPQYAAGSAY
jgi:hypothetical protein